jgi:hypothetical protein
MFVSNTLGSYSKNFIFFVVFKWPNKLEYYITLGQKGLKVTNTVAYWVYSKVIK